MRILMIVLATAVVAFGFAWSLGCCSAPEVTTLPEDEAAIRAVGDVETDPGEDPNAGAIGSTTAPAEGPQPVPTSTTYEALALRGVKGGRIRFAVPGTVGDVLRMLLDFEKAAGNRAWARSYRTLSRDEQGVLAQWTFRGKMGIAPTVQLRFRVEHADGGATVRYELKKKAFGIASFFGDYRLRPLPGTPPRVELAERVFIDSGIPIANASQEDIEKGLREDARLIRAWMEQRVQQTR